tara:strand:- start:923 stop:1168 length:246 start_codon:yes stop_codon:yes gene_type:complete
MNSLKIKILILGLIPAGGGVVAIFSALGIWGKESDVIHSIFADPSIAYPMLVIGGLLWFGGILALLPMIKKNSRTQSSDNT